MSYQIERFVPQLLPSGPRILQIKPSKYWMLEAQAVTTLPGVPAFLVLSLVKIMNDAVAKGDATMVGDMLTKLKVGPPIRQACLDAVGPVPEESIADLASRLAAYDSREELAETLPDGTQETRDYHVGPFTARTAAVLWYTANLMYNRALDDLYLNAPAGEPTNDQFVFWAELPKNTWGYSNQWRERILNTLSGIVAALLSNTWEYPRNLAEEVLWHLVVEDAEDRVDEGWGEEARITELLPLLPEREEDLDWMFVSDSLFEDTDFLLLWNEELPSAAVAEQLGLDLPDSEEQWFQPFHGDAS